MKRMSFDDWRIEARSLLLDLDRGQDVREFDERPWWNKQYRDGRSPEGAVAEWLEPSGVS